METQSLEIIAPSLSHDRVMRLVVAGFFLGLGGIQGSSLVALANRFLMAPNVTDGMRILAWTCVLLFYVVLAQLVILRHQPVAGIAGWRPRLEALLGTFLNFGIVLLPPRPLEVGASILSVGLLLTGTALAIFVLSHLGRSFSILAEARRLVTTGPYAVVRHPLYIAELLGTLGTFIQFASPAAFLLVVAQFFFQFRRMLNEEAVLSATFPEYREYSLRTPRLIPCLW